MFHLCQRERERVIARICLVGLELKATELPVGAMNTMAKPSQALPDLHPAFRFPFRRILPCISRCRKKPVHLIRNIPMPSRRIRKTSCRCSSLLKSPFFARRRSRRVLFRDRSNFRALFAGISVQPVLKIQNSFDVIASKLPECLCLDDNRDAVVAAAVAYSKAAGNEISRNADACSFGFRDAVTIDSNAACQGINGKHDSSISHLPEFVRLSKGSIDLPINKGNAAALSTATDFDLVAKEIRYIENEGMKICTADRISQCSTVGNNGDGDSNVTGDEINKKADAFIAKFREHIRLERRNSDLRYFERLNRSVV